MREGLESRRLGDVPPLLNPPVAAAADALHALHSKADLLHMPPVARAGRISFAVRYARELLRAFLRPWLSVQTDFNQLALEVLAIYHKEIARIHARLEATESRGVPAQAEPVPAGPGGVDVDEGGRDRPPDDARFLRAFFAYTRIPPPPARIFLVTDGVSEDRELAAFGYEVLPSSFGRDGPEALPADALEWAPAFPVPDGSVDAVIISPPDVPGPVRSGRILQEASRVLRPQGRAIIVWPLFGRERANTPGFTADAFPPGLVPLEILRAVVRAGRWSVTPHVNLSDPADLVLVAAEKRHAPVH